MAVAADFADQAALLVSTYSAYANSAGTRGAATASRLAHQHGVTTLAALAARLGELAPDAVALAVVLSDVAVPMLEAHYTGGNASTLRTGKKRFVDAANDAFRSKSGGAEAAARASGAVLPRASVSTAVVVGGRLPRGGGRALVVAPTAPPRVDARMRAPPEGARRAPFAWESDVAARLRLCVASRAAIVNERLALSPADASRDVELERELRTLDEAECSAWLQWKERYRAHVAEDAETLRTLASMSVALQTPVRAANAQARGLSVRFAASVGSGPRTPVSASVDADCSAAAAAMCELITAVHALPTTPFRTYSASKPHLALTRSLTGKQLRSRDVPAGPSNCFRNNCTPLAAKSAVNWARGASWFRICALRHQLVGNRRWLPASRTARARMHSARPRTHAAPRAHAAVHPHHVRAGTRHESPPRRERASRLDASRTARAQPARSHASFAPHRAFVSTQLQRRSQWRVRPASCSRDHALIEPACTRPLCLRFFTGILYGAVSRTRP